MRYRQKHQRTESDKDRHHSIYKQERYRGGGGPKRLRERTSIAFLDAKASATAASFSTFAAIAASSLAFMAAKAAASTSAFLDVASSSSFFAFSSQLFCFSDSVGRTATTGRFLTEDTVVVGIVVVGPAVVGPAVVGPAVVGTTVVGPMVAATVVAGTVVARTVEVGIVVAGTDSVIVPEMEGKKYKARKGISCILNKMLRVPVCKGSAAPRGVVAGAVVAGAVVAGAVRLTGVRGEGMGNFCMFLSDSGVEMKAILIDSVASFTI